MRTIIITILSLFSFLNAASVEEMAGEMLMVHFHGECANQDSAKLLNEVHVGGFIFYNWANELSGPGQVLKLTASLKLQASRRPLFFAVDQEGGRVVRLKNGFTSPPYAGEITSSNQAYAWAKRVGIELRDVGINMNLAPVVDVNSNPANPVIGLRSFSPDPQIVADRAYAALWGYRETAVLAVLKHFPGHGDTHVDSHYDLPVIEKTLAQLEQTELYPFRKLANEAPAIMTAHLLLPNLDAKPVTISPTIIQNLLIKEMQYEGLILTDSLAMQGIRSNSISLEEIAIQAIEAGHDILLLGGRQLNGSGGDFEISVAHVISIHKAICDAVKSGRLPQSRLKASYNKIRKAKNLLIHIDRVLSYNDF